MSIFRFLALGAALLVAALAAVMLYRDSTEKTLTVVEVRPNQGRNIDCRAGVPLTVLADAQGVLSERCADLGPVGSKVRK